MVKYTDNAEDKSAEIWVTDDNNFTTEFYLITKQSQNATVAKSFACRQHPRQLTALEDNVSMTVKIKNLLNYIGWESN